MPETTDTVLSARSVGLLGSMIGGRILTGNVCTEHVLANHEFKLL